MSCVSVPFPVLLQSILCLTSLAMHICSTQYWFSRWLILNTALWWPVLMLCWTDEWAYHFQCWVLACCFVPAYIFMREDSLAMSVVHLPFPSLLGSLSSSHFLFLFFFFLKWLFSNFGIFAHIQWNTCGDWAKSEHEAYLLSWMWYLAHTSSLQKLTGGSGVQCQPGLSASQSQNRVGCCGASVSLLGLPACLSPGSERHSYSLSSSPTPHPLLPLQVVAQA